MTMRFKELSKTKGFECSEGGQVAESNKERESNIELFRIIVMILIVAHHYVVNSGLTATDGPIYDNPLSFHSMFLLLFGAWGKIGINCFVLITGYFMCTKEIKINKFFKLFFEVFFYKLVIYLAFCITGVSSFSIKSFVLSIIPIQEIGTNFTGCFLVFYLAIPFLNSFIRKIDEKKHKLLLLLLCFVYILFGTIHQIKMNYFSWFIVLYLISSYIRLYNQELFSSQRWGLISLFVFLFDIIVIIISTYIGSRINRNISYAFVSDANTFLAVVTGIVSFLAFKNMRIKHSKVINWVASSTFGVLCIHANSDIMRKWLWGDIINCVGNYDSHWLVPYATGCILCIFVVCILIDKVRIRFIEIPFLRLWNSFYNKIQVKYSEK